MKTSFAYRLLAFIYIAACSVVVYAKDEHVKKAIQELEQAVESGKKGDAEGVARHTEEAKKHVVEENKEHPYIQPFKPVYGQEQKAEHDKETFEEMEKAIAEAKKGHAKEAGEAAGRAVAHLKEKEESKE